MATNGAGARRGAVAGAVGGGILGLVAGIFLWLLTIALEDSSGGGSSTGAAIVFTLVLALIGAALGAAFVAVLGAGVAALDRQARAGRIPVRVQRLGLTLLVAAGGFFIGGNIVGEVSSGFLGYEGRDTASVLAAVGGGIVALVVGLLTWRRSSRRV